MKRIDSHSFNNEVLAEINKVKTLLTKITPENVKYFDDELLRKARGVVNYPNEYKWGDSTINSIDVKTVKRLTDWRKIKNIEYIVVDKTSEPYKILPDVYSSGDSKDYGTAQIKINTPEKYDGRSSFVIPIFRYNTTDESKKDFEIGFVGIDELINKNNASVQIHKSETQISLNARVPAKAGSGYYTYFWLSFIVLYWRKK
jgi:hypothetical protein